MTHSSAVERSTADRMVAGSIPAASYYYSFTHSSVWLERSTVNRDVGGSNPPG